MHVARALSTMAQTNRRGRASRRNPSFGGWSGIAKGRGEGEDWSAKRWKFSLPVHTAIKRELRLLGFGEGGSEDFIRASRKKRGFFSLIRDEETALDRLKAWAGSADTYWLAWYLWLLQSQESLQPSYLPATTTAAPQLIMYHLIGFRRTFT